MKYRMVESGGSWCVQEGGRIVSLYDPYAAQILHEAAVEFWQALQNQQEQITRLSAEREDLLTAVNNLLIAEATNFGGPKFKAAFQRLEELAIKFRSSKENFQCK